MTKAVTVGDTISVHYTGRFENGEVFDSSEDRSPLKFTVGAGQLVKGFDDAVVGMMPGEKKTVNVSPEEGYGEHNPDYVIDFPKANIPPEMKLEVGMQLQMSDQAGQPVPVFVAEILDNLVKLDANHPLAGKTLVFDVHIVETGLEADCGNNCSCGCSGCGS